MTNTKHEDAIMKMGFGYFRDSILKRLGVEYEFVAEEPTELIGLQIYSMYMGAHCCFLMGLGNMGLGNAEKAKEYLREMLELDPHHLMAKLYLRSVESTE